MIRLLRAQKILLIMTFSLIALGGAVRAMNAGLACPDWPLCFGDVIPDYHPQVYFEFIHRVLAGLVALITIGVAVVIYRRPDTNRTDKNIMTFALVVLASQVILGGLTVTMQLHDKVVTAHLAFGSAFLMSLFWIYWRLRHQVFPYSVKVSKGMAVGALTVAAVVYTQILLGGLVASNYAALVCTDFPTCHGEFIPTLKGAIGLQVIHRLGAYTTGLVILFFALATHLRQAPMELRRTSLWMLALVLVQIGIGIANVLLYTPPLITVLHLATGVGLLSLAMRSVFIARETLFKRAEYRAGFQAKPSETQSFAYSGHRFS